MEAFISNVFYLKVEPLFAKTQEQNFSGAEDCKFKSTLKSIKRLVGEKKQKEKENSYLGRIKDGVFSQEKFNCLTNFQSKKKETQRRETQESINKQATFMIQ